MSFTRLHFILMILLVGTASVVFVTLKEKSIEEKYKAESLRQKTAEKPVPAFEKPINKEELRKTISIAGEYWKIAKKKDLDRFPGETSLRQAKIEFSKDNFNEAQRLAVLSIRQLKTAPKLGVNYTVRSLDSLWKIAKMKIHYGKGSKWVKIWRANQDIIPDFDLIYPKQNLFVPGVKKQ